MTKKEAIAIMEMFDRIISNRRFDKETIDKAIMAIGAGRWSEACITLEL